jgi:O-antigen/teichoic acid export membrane protein
MRRLPATVANRRPTAPPSGLPRSGQALAAGAAQLGQAAGSFVLQLVAAHALGASGLGVVSLCLGVMILATALTSGVVGDSLTVLDRHDPRVRAGLQVWGLLLPTAGAAAASAALTAEDVLSPREGAAFLAATLAFQWEEVVRRVLMARMRFWTLLAVDAVGLASTVVALGIAAALAVLDLQAFFVAVACGQVVAAACGVLLLPTQERRLVPLRGAAVAEVLAFGGWRGAQVAVTPLSLTATRLVVVAAAGSAALGEVEAARILGAPALLLVQGLGSTLLAAFARDRLLPLAVLRELAGAAAMRLALTALLVGTLLTVLGGVAGPAVVGPLVDVDPWTVLGWAVFAAAVGSMQPFAVLAVTRGGQRAVFALRCLDAATGVGLLALLLGVPVVEPSATPYVLAAGPVLGGLLIRRLLLRDHPTGKGIR